MNRNLHLNHIIPKILILFLFSVITFSCDIPGIIRVKNLSKEKITFQLYKKSKYENENLIQFELRPSEESYIYFGGFGTTWTEENLKTYVSGIDSLLILEKEDTLRLNDQNSIYKYFKNRRRGPFKDEILIKIK